MARPATSKRACETILAGNEDNVEFSFFLCYTPICFCFESTRNHKQGYSSASFCGQAVPLTDGKEKAVQNDFLVHD